MKIERFEDILSWQHARELTRLIHRLTKRRTFADDAELRSQMRRASGSIMHNIAEGFDGGSSAEFAKFLRYAQRSSTEIRSQLYVAIDQEYIDAETFDDLYVRCEKIHALIGGLIKSLKKRAPGSADAPFRPPCAKRQSVIAAHQEPRTRHE